MLAYCNNLGILLPDNFMLLLGVQHCNTFLIFSFFSLRYITIMNFTEHCKWFQCKYFIDVL